MDMFADLFSRIFLELVKGDYQTILIYMEYIQLYTSINQNDKLWLWHV